jgi:pimeloyl-ACP methyl ester carboxylesterase
LYLWQFAVDDIAAVMRDLKIERAHLIGLSMGGYAALQFGLRYLEKTSAWLKETSVLARIFIEHGMVWMAACRLMAHYNTWQNTSLVTAADGLTNEDRWKDRGAFFQSIAATLNHLYWADALILERLKGNERPEETIKHSLTSPSDWDAFKALRLQRN